MPGMGELLVILVIVFIIFGAGKLPELGHALGRGIRNFKKAANEADQIEVTPENRGQLESARPDAPKQAVLDDAEAGPKPSTSNLKSKNAA